MDYRKDHELEETNQLYQVDHLPLSDDYQPRRGRGRGGRKRGRVRWGRVIAVLLMLFALLGLGYYWVSGMFGNAGVAGLLSRKQVVPVLLIGSDQRNPNEQARSDTIIVAFINPKDQKVCLLSVPRDTYATIPGHYSKGKINAAHAYGGPEDTAKAVSDLLGIDLHYYVETNFKGFARIVDTLGGITINVDQRMYYPEEGINLHSGVQKLQGKEALAFVRFRGYPMGDIDRIKHQQSFFLALADQTMRLQNVWKLPELIGDLNAAVKTNLSTVEMIQLAEQFKGFDRSRIKGYTLPGEPRYIKGISYWIPDLEQGREVASALQQGLTPQLREPQVVSPPPTAKKSTVTKTRIIDSGA